VRMVYVAKNYDIKNLEEHQ